MQKFIVGFLFILAIVRTGNSQGWIGTYNGQSNGDDRGYGIVVDGAGNIITTGYTTNDTSGIDIIITKYNNNGVFQWKAFYSGQGYNTDRSFGIAVDGSNNIIVTGYTTLSNGTTDYLTIKYNSAGVRQWVKTYNGTGNNEDKAWGIVVDGNDNIFVTGISKGSTSYDCVTIRYLANGNESWNRRYNGPQNGEDAGMDIVSDASNNIYVCGYGAFTGNAGFDYLVLKYNNGGSQQWVKNYNGTGNDEDKAWGIAVDNSNNIYITGTSAGNGTKTDIATLKYNSSGTQQWLNRFNGTDNHDDRGYGIAVDNVSGSCYITGSVEMNASGLDYAAIKLNNSNGTVAWNRLYDGPGHNMDVPNAITVSNSSQNRQIYIAGISRSGTTQQSEDIAIVIYSSAGVQLRADRYNGSANLDDAAFGIAVDGNDNYYIAGYIGVETDLSSVPSYDMITMKYTKLDVTGINITSNNIPDGYKLYQNYPNPFNPVTNIKFDVAELSQVKIAVYDITGRVVETIIDKQIAPGSYEISLDASKLSSGVYFYSLQAGSFKEIKKMSLVK